ncbi:hypothetical protein TNCT_331461 [Trichonephila clavata]|uniref:Uncharacterized protein n=1 Tax=Trichonephila clavata TaxID=2740835 RepID=A0A8X6KNM4_TRICU|nr:hypothetical protein TNCT_331461 [Trichonephila clavata]
MTAPNDVIKKHTSSGRCVKTPNRLDLFNYDCYSLSAKRFFSKSFEEYSRSTFVCGSFERVEESKENSSESGIKKYAKHLLVLKL